MDIPRQPISSTPFTSLRKNVARVVVGVDGSPASVRALAWAFTKASERAWALKILTIWPVNAPVVVHGVPGHFCEPRWSAIQSQSAAVAAALAMVDRRPAYTLSLENGVVRDLLVTAAEQADILVLGHDEGTGSLSADVRRLAEGRVVVIPNDLWVPEHRGAVPARASLAI